MQLIPVTTPARTIVDMGATAGRWLTERALDSALRSGAAELDDIQQVIDDVGRQGRRGVALARDLVGERRAWVVATESELEEDFARLVRNAGLRLPESQVELRDGEDGFIGRADFAYLDRRLVVELDGYGFHSDPAAFKRDRERQNRILMAGYRILRYTAADLRDRPSGVVAEIRAALSVPDNGRVENRRGD